MNALYGLYPDPDSAQRAVDALRATGGPLGPQAGFGQPVPDADIVIVSSEPFESYEFGRRDHRTLMPWIAALGGLLGGIGGFWLAAFTQRAYALPTGGMPIVSLWTNGIVAYEMTMLGAILATLVTLLVTTRLPHWSHKETIYDPAVSEGKILVGVTNPHARARSELERRLREAGAEKVVSSQ
jgi:hypothetical protein